MIKKVKNMVPWTYVFSDLNVVIIIGAFYKNELQITNQTKFKVGKVTKKLINCFFKWKGYDNSFNIRINENDVV